jgi:carboxymethylenebutenolidase
VGTDLRLALPDGSEALAHLALPAAGPAPGVLVLHAWWGLTDTFRDAAEHLAREGFVALAPDLVGGRTAGTIEEAEALVNEVDEDRVAVIAAAALDALLRRPEVRPGPAGVVGFSFGAAHAVLLATTQPDDVAAAVCFYGIYAPDLSPARAAFEFHLAENDPFEPEENVAVLEEALQAAGRPYEIHRYAGTGHWFAEPNRPDAYDASAAELAWMRTVDFLRTRLGSRDR